MRSTRIVNSIVVGLVLLLFGAATADDQTKPNIVVIFTDDVGCGDISCLNPQASFETPTIDQLAKSGMTFTHAHSIAAICMPSRYGFLCGNYVFRGRSDLGNYKPCRPCQIRKNQDTIANVLRNNGYRTCFVGKWHLGIQFKSDNELRPARSMDEADLSLRCFDGPLDHGFDESLVLISGNHSSPFAYFEDDRLVRWNEEDQEFHSFDTNELARQMFKRDEDQSTPLGKLVGADSYRIDNWSFAQVGPLLTHKVLKFIEQATAAQQPFFVHLCTGAAHTPYGPPSNFDPASPDGFLDPGPNPVRGHTQHPRTDMVYETDLTTKAILEKLAELGALANTIVIYTSDNGASRLGNTQWSDPIYYSLRNGLYGGIRIDCQDTGRIQYNAQGIAADGQPLRGVKGDIYEGGHRVPLIIRWGDEKNGWKIQPGSHCDDLVGLHDIFRTLADISGSTIPNGQAIDSQSFADALKGNSTGSRRFLLAQGRLCQAGEQQVVKTLIKQKHAMSILDREGRVIGAHGGELEDANPKDLQWMVYSNAIGRAIYFRENGREWKLLFSTACDHQLDDIQPWELYELTSDPSESENLVDEERLHSLIDMMIDKYRQIVARNDQGDSN